MDQEIYNDIMVMYMTPFKISYYGKLKIRFIQDTTIEFIHYCKDCYSTGIISKSLFNIDVKVGDEYFFDVLSDVDDYIKVTMDCFNLSDYDCFCDCYPLAMAKIYKNSFEFI
jgi:hypothetical protein